MRKIAGLLLLFTSFLLTSCTKAPEKSEEYFFAMDTYMTIEAYGETAKIAVSQARARVEALEKLWSATDENSEIFAINHGKNPELSEETLDLLSFTLEMSEKTGGAFDATIYPVLTAWGFTTEQKRVPEEAELAELLEKVGYEKVSADGKKISLEQGMMLDFGGAAKGWASDECAEIMRESGVKSALINLGGNVYAVGKRPDGNLWRIGVADPLSENSENAGIVEVSDRAVVTSGSYQRYFTQDGKTYGHIIDPKTGYPADNDLLSVTIVAEEGKLCDVLSTALFVMGREQAERFWRENGGFEMILIDKSGGIFVTEGIAGDFSSDRTVNTIK